jgi:FAD:protein FMN transferase
MPFLTAPIMGTTVSINVRDAFVGDDVLEQAMDALRDIDARFSTFRGHSEISRVDRGDLRLEDAHPDVRDVLAACDRLRAESGGAFNAWRDGHLDPSGYVKGWAAERAADLLRDAGAGNFALNLGGDVICSGERVPGQPWRVGIRHPDDPMSMLLVLAVQDRAVATSGLYERGDHITDARSGAVPGGWRSLTVIGPDLTTADAIATAALARGEDGPAWAAARLGCDVVALDRSSRLFTSKGIESVRLE